VQTVPLTAALVDTVGEKALHMVNADPNRTPTFTMFGNPDFFFQTTNLSGGCVGSNVCVNPGFAWNHGDSQEEIGNTWAGFVGPGVNANGVDATTWADHVDLRPTINSILGLSDAYQDDGRVITEILSSHAISNQLNEHGKTTTQLGAIYKQVNAPFGQFATDTLSASTAAIKTTDDLKYDRIETAIANLTTERNQLAGQVRTALNDAAAGNAQIDESQAKAWIKQAQSLLDRAHALAQANPA
jgi:hypothetical protein